MGYKIAEEASKRNHKVTLITGPTGLKAPKVKKFISIETAAELFSAVKKELKNADCLIMCAAVGDFKSKRVFKKKIKRNKGLLLELVPSRDILSGLSRYKKGKIFVGFSLETDSLIRHSRAKLKNKNLDLIVANRLRKFPNVFGDNKLDVYIIDKYGFRREIKYKRKAFIAHVLLDKIEKMWYLKSN